MKKSFFFKGLNSFFLTCLLICFLFSHSFSMSHDQYDKEGAGDNTRHHATPILINDPNHSQLHNLYDPNDVDWVIFHAYPDREYIVSVQKSGIWDCNYSLNAYIYDPNGRLLPDDNKPRTLHFFEDDLDRNDIYLCPYCNGDPNHICEGFFNQAGFYFLQFERKSSGMCQRNRTTDAETQTDTNNPYGYEIIAITDGYPGTSTILGYVLNEYDFGLGGAQVMADNDGIDPPYLTTKSWANGVYYLFDLQAGGDQNYQVYAKMPGYSDSQKISISLKENALYKLNISLPSIPPSSGSDTLPASNDPPFSDTPSREFESSYYVSFLHTGGVNFFSFPCQLSQCDCNSVIRQGYNFLNKYYDPNYNHNQYSSPDYDPIQFLMKFQKQNSDGHWQTCYLDTNQSKEIIGTSFSLDTHEGYLIYIDIPDPNKNIKSLPFIFKCAEDPNKDRFNLSPGINLIGLSSDTYDAYGSLEDPNVFSVDPNSNYLPESISCYNHSKGSFRSTYRFFGKLCGHSFKLLKDKGYILSVKNGGSP